MNSVEYEQQVLNLKMERLVTLIENFIKEVQNKKQEDNLAEWLTLEKAVQLKGGGSIETYKTRLHLQPCCGKNSKRICGRKCWHRIDVLEWVLITDEDIASYAQKWGIIIPPEYRRRKVS